MELVRPDWVLLVEGMGFHYLPVGGEWGRERETTSSSGRRIVVWPWSGRQGGEGGVSVCAPGLGCLGDWGEHRWSRSRVEGSRGECGQVLDLADFLYGRTRLGRL